MVRTRSCFKQSQDLHKSLYTTAYIWSGHDENVCVLRRMIRSKLCIDSQIKYGWFHINLFRKVHVVLGRFTATTRLAGVKGIIGMHRTVQHLSCCLALV